MSKHVFAAAALAATLFSGAASASTAHYDSAWFFGDSLSDNGNLYAEYAYPPSPPYYMGRVSNGPVWSDHIAGDFEAKGRATGNYAYAFATASSTASHGPFDVPNLAEQIAAFKADANPLGATPIAFIWIGNNDAFASIASATPPYLPQIGAAMADAVGAIGDGIVSLVGAGIENFMVFNVPPFEATPAFTQENPAAAPLAAYAAGVYNALLAQQLAGLAGVADIELFDANLAFLDVLTDPAAFGISNVKDACLDPPAICPDPDSYLFWDDVHPTATIHAEIADRVRASVAPVPLPASLLLVVVAAAALGGVGLRRRA